MALISLDSCLRFGRQSVSRAALLVFTALPLLPAPSLASGCDDAFMDKMKERAFLEAQREISMNKEAIWQPDSVLTLSCFRGQVDAQEITFSCEEDGDCPGATGNDVTDFVEEGVAGYLSIIFGGSPGVGGGNTDIAPETEAPPGSCDTMDDLWDRAQECANVDQDKDFPSFEEMAAEDPDPDPTPCTVPDTAAQYEEANRDMAAVGLNMGEGKFDSVNLYLNVWAPLSTLDSGTCFEGIPTGVKVGGASGFEEVVCPNPGCSPQLSGSSVTCEPTP